MKKPAKPLLPPPPPEPYKVGYARVSTLEQSLELQINALVKAGVKTQDIHVEKVSGVSSRRPMLDNAIAALRRGDEFVIWRFDRIGRTVEQVYERLKEIKEAGATLRSLTEHFDLKTTSGRMMFHMAIGFAQMERDVIRERTQAGMDRLKAEGRSLGRPAKLTKPVLTAIFKRLRKGEEVPALAKEHDVTPGALYAYFKFDVDARGKRVVSWKKQPK